MRDLHLHLEPVKRRKYFAALLLLLPALVFAGLLAFFALNKKSTSGPSQEEFVPQLEERETSRWATDSAVLQLEAAIGKLENDETASLQEELSFPALDFETADLE